MESRVRQAAVAGRFYPAEMGQCRELVQGLLGENPGPSHLGAVHGLIAPHAGYIYSGGTAATAYNALAAGGAPEVVAILGPNHRVPLQGVAVDGHHSYKTPLGEVPVAVSIGEQLIGLPGVARNDRAHRDEHCIEVHLPFLQSLFGEFQLVPLLVGEGDIMTTVELVEILVRQHQASVLISSDLSHHLPYDIAIEQDRLTGECMDRLSAIMRPEQACGCAAINGMNLFARRAGWRAQLLERKNSGDTAGGREQVVGYGAYAYIDAE